MEHRPNETQLAKMFTLYKVDLLETQMTNELLDEQLDSYDPDLIRKLIRQEVQDQSMNLAQYELQVDMDGDSTGSAQLGHGWAWLGPTAAHGWAQLQATMAARIKRKAQATSPSFKVHNKLQDLQRYGKGITMLQSQMNGCLADLVNIYNSPRAEAIIYLLQGLDGLIEHEGDMTHAQMAAVLEEPAVLSRE